MKKGNQTHWILQEIAEDRSPESTINLWPTIKSRLGSNSKERRNRALRGFLIKKSFLYAAVILVLIVIAATAFIPVVRAQVAGWISGQTTLFSFLTPQSKVTVGLFSDGAWGFVPLSPTYLPSGKWVTVPDSFRDEGTGLETLKLTINKGGQFVILTERKTTTDETLPLGDTVKVDEHPAALFTGLSGEIDAGIPLAEDGGVLPGPSGQVNLKLVQYTDGVRLVWHVGEIRLEIISNIPLRQVMKIAASLRPVETEPAQMTTTEP